MYRTSYRAHSSYFVLRKRLPFTVFVVYSRFPPPAAAALLLDPAVSGGSGPWCCCNLISSGIHRLAVPAITARRPEGKAPKKRASESTVGRERPAIKRVASEGCPWMK